MAIFYYSLLTGLEMTKLVQAELDSLEEVVLNKSLFPESLTIETLKTHVQSIYCSCEQEEVSYIVLNNCY
jgi:hypothetical protein